MKKRLISLLLVLVLAFTLVPSAFADTSDCGLAGCTLFRVLLLRILQLPPQ